MKKWISFLPLVFLFIQLGQSAFASTDSCPYESRSSGLTASETVISSEKDAIIFRGDMSPTEVYASKLYSRLTGATIPSTHPRFRKIVSLIKEGKTSDAVKLIMLEKNFLQVRVRNFAAPFSSKDGSTKEPFNDLQALIIGITRDELDARLLLTGDIRYSGYSYLGIPKASKASNDHYLQFDDNGYNFDTDLELVHGQWEDLGVAAGALTTRAWGMLRYDAGTNRKGVRDSFNTFLCVPIEGWKMRGLPDYFVRRDVPREGSPTPFTFQNHCRYCHAPMDAMGGAFAKLDFVDGALIYKKDGVTAKMNQLGEHYPAGYVTIDDSWNNLLKTNAGYDFGWRTTLDGQHGIQAFGQMLANSFAFSRCLTTKAFKEICGKIIKVDAPGLLDVLSHDFEDHGYNLKYLFETIAMRNECIAHEENR